MDNEKELKRAELSDDKIDAVSGGKWASDEDFEYTSRLLNEINEEKYDKNTCIRASIIWSEMFESSNSYTGKDFRDKLREELHIEV